MKKFKFRKKYHIKKIIIVIVLLVLFILLSFCTLNRVDNKILNILTSNFSDYEVSLNMLTANLDNLINSYSFKKIVQVNKEEKNIIYLYNTHDQEEYLDKTTIYDATKLLKDKLVKLGINVILEEKKTSELVHTGLSNYDISRSFIKNVMNKDIKYYIDIHRDSVKDTKITINNKKYAKIMFVLGLENKNYEKNKKEITKMNNYLNEKYPGISKGIYEKKGSGVDGVYNQDLSENVLLIEIGGVENNFEEINNSTEIIALMIYHMLGEI